MTPNWHLVDSDYKTIAEIRFREDQIDALPETVSLGTETYRLDTSGGFYRTAPSPEEATSPSTEARLPLDGNQPKKCGLCVWVIPGATTSSRSPRTAVNASGLSGACSDHGGEE